jgi:hypothetical protein
MHIDCIVEASKAAGRPLTDAEIAKIEADITEHMKTLSRAKPQEFAAMSHAERVMAAAQLAQQTALAAAALKKQRALQQVVTAASMIDRFNEARSSGLNGAQSVNSILEQADIYMKGVAPEYFAKLIPTINAIEPRFFGLMEDVAQVRVFVHEVLKNADGSSGDTKMQKAARAWLDTIEAMRLRFNRAGGDIGKLAYGYLPQVHDASRVRAVTADAWANQVMPLLDRSRYVDLNGRRLNDQTLLGVLRDAHATISTNGYADMVPGQNQGTGARANRGSDHRVIHFKDADSYITYMGDFGDGSVYSSMRNHVIGIGRDIGLVEQFGPNPNMMFKTLDDMAVKADGSQVLHGSPFLLNSQKWNVLSGFSNQVQNQQFANIAQQARDTQVFGKLQQAVVSSITDLNTYFITTRFHRLPTLTATADLIRAFSGDKGMREFANRNAMVAESMISDLTKWSDSNLKDQATSKIANLTMKVSLMNAWTNAVRRAFSVSMMGNLGKLSRKDFVSLDKYDQAHMRNSGVTDDDWKIWKIAMPEKWRNSDMLTPESIRAVTDDQLKKAGLIAQVGDPKRASELRDRATSRLIGLITDESEYASVAPDLYTRTLISGGGQQRGTLGGESARTVGQFKSFPIAMMSRHMNRMLKEDMSPASRIEYGIMLAVFGSILGGIALQLKDMTSGKDPRDMTTPKFWLAALMQGGGLGYIADLIYQLGGGKQSQGGVSSIAQGIASMAGPVVGTAAEVVDLTAGNAFQAARGEDTHAGAEALRLVRSNAPFVNLWYAKTVVDHAGFNQLQELLSPGYQSRVAQRIRRDWGQEMWWPKDSTLPDRAPNFANAVGE